MILGGFPGANVSPLGTIAGGSIPTVNVNGGLLALQNNGAGNGGLITYNDLTIDINPSLSAAGIFVANLSGANVSNTIEVPNLDIASGQTLNVTNANNYQLRLDVVDDGTPGSGAPHVQSGRRHDHPCAHLDGRQAGQIHGRGRFDHLPGYRDDWHDHFDHTVRWQPR